MSQDQPSRYEKIRQLGERLVPILDVWDVRVMLVGLVAIIIQHGAAYDQFTPEPGLLVVLAMLVRGLRVSLKWILHEDRRIFFQENRRACVVVCAWSGGALILLLFGPVLPVWFDSGRGPAVAAWSEMFLLLNAGARLLRFISRTTGTGNPALIFVLSFLALITVGTIVLMLPGSQSEIGRAPEFGDRLRIALFTSTSASCVTGLTVVPTGGEAAHWSRFGQVTIMLLFQIGGLGIMSLGAVFALLMGRRLAFRESAAVSKVTDAVTVRDVRRLLLAILATTLSCELIGVLLLSTLWSDLPLGEQLFFGLFHSISAFCNAGFALTENSFVEMGTRWQVWGVLSTLIIIGGLGFGTLTSLWNVAREVIHERRQPRGLFARRRIVERFPLSARLVLTSSVLLLLGGMLMYWLLESTGVRANEPAGDRLAEAWFQSVTFRTAGFNTVDHSDLQPGTKLFAIGLMFVGASPGSTGGGVKTIAVAIIVLTLLSILRGRERVECHGRTIPGDQIRSAFILFFMGLVTTMLAALLLSVFENNSERFIDHLFEATSAYATVGVSADITGKLTAASQIVLIITMFVGRIGPLTLLVALTNQNGRAYYQYPEERVALG